MGTTGVIKIGRQELYERVWSTPMMTVCRDYGIRNVGLAKVCRRHKIPCLPRGYWAKTHSGQSVRRTPLPVCPDPILQTVEIHPTPPKPARQAVAFDPTSPPSWTRSAGFRRSPSPPPSTTRTRWSGRGVEGEDQATGA